MGGLRVLITNNTLADPAGTERYVRDLAGQLIARGHRPIAYSTELGDTAVELRRAAVPVVDDLAALGEPPDIIHAQHHLDAMTALLRFPDVPAVFVCHGWLPWPELPVRFPSIRRYIAIDELCRERLVMEHGVAPALVRMIDNGVDLERFCPRSPLPNRPRRALLFSNYADDGAVTPIVSQACHAAGIDLDVIGRAAGAACHRPEERLGDYDIVFARGRCALEAIAVGAAVILCGSEGAGPHVTHSAFDRLRAHNFGLRELRQPLAADVLAAEIERYDPADAALVSARARAKCGLDAIVGETIDLYQTVLLERSPPRDLAAEAQAASAYLRSLAVRLKQFDRTIIAAECANKERRHWHDECARLHATYGSALEERDQLLAERDELRQQLADLIRGRLTIGGRLAG